MRKGLSPIISAILILLIAISVTLLAIIWLPRFISNIFPWLSFNESYIRSRGCLSIENVDGLFGLFTIKNCGKVALSDFSFFIDSSFISKLNIGTLDPSQTIDFYSMPITGGRHSLYITADYAESPPYAVDVPYWECIGGEPLLIGDWYVSKIMSCICSYNTVIPVTNVYVIGNGSLSLYNCILFLSGSSGTSTLNVRDNGFLSFIKSRLDKPSLNYGTVVFEDNSTEYILNSSIPFSNGVSPLIRDEAKVTAMNSYLNWPGLSSNIPHRLSVSNFNGRGSTGSPITNYIKADDSNFTVNFTNVSFYFVAFSISDNSNTTFSNSFFETFTIISENRHNLTISNFTSNYNDHFKAEGSNFELRGTQLYPSWPVFYMNGNSNNTVINSSIAELRISSGHNSTNMFTNFNSYGNWYLYGNYFTMNFTNTVISGNGQIYLGECSGSCMSIWNFSNTTIYDNRRWDFIGVNVIIFGNITYLGNPFVGTFSNANVTRYFPTIIKDSNSNPFPTVQPAVVNITNYLNQSVWLGNVSGGTGTYYIDNPNIVFNASNYGPANFSMRVSQVCENITNITLLSNTSLEFTVNRSYNYGGTPFNTVGNAVGLAFDNLNFIVASSNGSVHAYTNTGFYIGSLATSLNGLRDVASNGTYYWLLNYNSSEKKVYRYRKSDGGYDNSNFSISAVTEPYAVDFDGESFWVLGNTTVYKYNITGGYTGFSFNLDRLPGVYYGDIVSSSGNIWVLTENYSSSKGRGVFRYKTDGTFDNWYFDMAPTTITGRGLAFNGTYFWVMNSAGTVFRYGFNRNCLDFMKNCDEFITFLPYTINKNNTRYCLIYSLYAPGQTGITFANSVQNTSLDCQYYNINGNGAASTVGVYLTGNKNDTLNNCNINSFDNGIKINSSSNNIITNVNSYSNGIGIVVDSSSNNTVSSCSINGNINNDYYLANLGMNNNFTNTNFTDYRTIYFYDSTSWFNYANSSTSMLTFGKTDIGSVRDQGYSGGMFGSKFTLSESAIVSKISYYGHTYLGSNAVIGIYSDSSGSPGTLQAQSNIISLPGGDVWNNFTLNAILSPGIYWLIIRCDSCYFAYDNGGTDQFAFRWDPGYLPNPFGPVVSNQNYNMSIFATYMPNIQLKTSTSAQAQLTRKLVNWNDALIQWKDTSSTAITTRYNVTGLVPGAPYSVYDNSVELVNSPIKTDSLGTLRFTINLLASQEHDIKVVEICDYYLYNASLPYAIDKNNTYYCLISNASRQTPTAISFSSSIQNSTIDCLNNYIRGRGSNYGVSSSGYNISIKNCNISRWSSGIYLSGAIKNNVYNNTLSEDGNYFINLVSYSKNNNISKNTIKDGAYGYGIWLETGSDSNTIFNNYINNTFWFGMYIYSNSNTLINNVIDYCTSVDTGIVIINSNNTLVNNTFKVYHNSSLYSQGLVMYGGRNFISEDNTINGLPMLFFDGIVKACPNNTVFTNGSSYGFLGFYGCNNVTVKDYAPSDSVAFFQMSNSTIANLKMNYTQFAIHVDSPQRNIIIANNTLNGNNNGIYFHWAQNVTVINNTISFNSVGIDVYGGGALPNTIFNNTISYNTVGFRPDWTEPDNNVTGGSIYNNVYDYQLEWGGTNSNFTNTNFTAARTIDFGFTSTSPWFNYANDTSGLWLKTNVSASSTITRKLLSWNQTFIRWSDNSGSAITANYNIIGLSPSIAYYVYNNSVKAYTLISDSSGQISFTIDLPAGQEQEIRIVKTVPPMWFANSTNNTVASQPTMFSLNWTDDFGLSGYIFSTNNSGVWQNDTWRDFENQPGNALFIDGFESGDFSKWTGSGTQSGNTLGIQSSIKYQGSYAARATLGNYDNYEFTKENIDNGSRVLAFARSYVRYESAPSSGNEVLFLTLQSVTAYPGIIAGIGIKNVGGILKFCFDYMNGTLQEATIDSPVPSPSTWYSFEVKGYINNGAGEARGYINGLELFTFTNLNNSAGVRLYEVDAGPSNSGGTGTRETYWDNVVISNSYIGPFNSWSNVTESLNSNVGKLVQWCVYANDSDNNWNSTSCSDPFVLTTT